MSTAFRFDPRALLVTFAALLALSVSACSGLRGPSPAGSLPEDRIGQERSSADLRYLASDALLGRGTGTPGADSAAAYIARRWRDAGAVSAPSMDGFLQQIAFAAVGSPDDAALIVDGYAPVEGLQVVMLSGRAGIVGGPSVFVGFGTEASDYAEANGKLAVALIGSAEAQGVGDAVGLAETKRYLALRSGAVGLVEVYAQAVPWPRVRAFLAGPRVRVMPDAEELTFPHAWISGAPDSDAAEAATALRGDAQARLTMPGMVLIDAPPSSNVVAVVPGSDPDLADEYVLLTAHYDHLGAGLDAGAGATPADSIFNGARDNGMGTTALLIAADALAADPPRRSVLLVAFTAEERGLLGSRFFADHSPVPLDRIVYNLNIDGGGYTDTTAITLIGKGRTSADSLIAQGAARYGLAVLDDPSPEQGLFDRSDNVAFAAKGIPAPTFSPGFTSFSLPGVSDFYHRPADEADETFDFAYLHRFTRAYAHAARLIADAAAAPTWTPGDRYEAAARALYGPAYPGD
jgi:hypothetical protein